MDFVSLIEPLVAVIAVSLVSLIGVFTLSINKEKMNKLVFVLVSLAAGTLIGDAFIHLIPESFESIGNSIYVSLGVIGGILIFFILENFGQWRHCHKELSDGHNHPLILTNLVGDGVHNLIDGLIIGGSFLVSSELGWISTLAIVLHEIPQEIGDFAILIYAGMEKKKALMFNLFSGLIAAVGVIVALIFGSVSSEFASYILPFAAGGFIYISVADLIPELKENCQDWKENIIKFTAILLGVVLMYLFTLIELH